MTLSSNSPAPGRPLKAVVTLESRLDRCVFPVFATFLSVSLFGFIAFLIDTEQSPPWWQAGLFVLLIIAAEHRDRLFGDETSISASLVIVIASVVVFRETSPLLGPLFCASFAGLYWTHCRERAFAKLAINSTSIGFSALAAAATYAVISGGSALPPGEVVLLCLPTVLVYWIVNSVILAVAMTVLHRGTFASTALSLIRSETVMLLFAMAGGVCGLLFTEVSGWAGVGGLIALLVLADAVVCSRFSSSERRTSRTRFARTGLLAAAVSGAAGTAFGAERFASVPALPVGVAVGALVLMSWATIAVRRRLGTWDFALAWGVVIVDLPAVVLASVGGLVAGLAGAAVAVAVVIGGFTVWRIAVSIWPRPPITSYPDDDLLITTAVELALLDRPIAPVSR